MTRSVAVVDRETGEITEFRPPEAKVNIAKADAIIEYAERLKDWPLLYQAVEQKIEEQAEFVAWWREKVSVSHGAGRGKKGAVRGAFSLPDAESLTGITHQQVSRWAKALGDRDKYREKLYGAAYKKAMGETAHYLAGGTGENEWYTPADIIRLAREVMGDIDLDPASCEEANETVKAARFFTAKNDGLKQEWRGRVWLNPPYSRDLMPAFVMKLIGEFSAERTTQAVMVSHNNTDTRWFQDVARVASAVCFPAARIRFYRGNDVAAPVNGQVFVYLGDNSAAFTTVFGALGAVMEPCT